MGQEKTRKGRSIALSGFIGFVLASLLVGMLIGGYLALFVIAPQMQSIQQSSNNQGLNGNQNSNSQYNNNNQGPTATPNNQNNNPYPTGTQNDNYATNNPNQTNNCNQTISNQNSNNTQGVNNNYPAPTNPTGQYNALGTQLNVNIPENGTQTTGTILATINCVVQQNGNNIQLALTIMPTTVPESLSQAIGNSPVTFNFAGTTSGLQINANAAGSTGPDASDSFHFNLNGSFTSNKLTLTITPASDSKLSLSTPQPITLQSN